MVQNCCVVDCSNRGEKGSTHSFHDFPRKDASLLAAWIARISRKNPDGSDWSPRPRDRVCSAHFVEADFFKGHNRRVLKPRTVPSLFENYPTHKAQIHTQRRKSPKKRPMKISISSASGTKPKISASSAVSDHSYTFPSVEAHLAVTKKKLELSVEKKKQQSSQVQNLKRKLCRREKKIEALLEDIQQRNMIKAGDFDILDNNFNADTRAVIENELQSLQCSAHNHVYSEELKSFAVSLHFYSAQAYEYVRTHLHLPHADTIRRWSSSYNVEPGFLADVVAGLKRQLEEDINMTDVAVMFDSMSLRKQVLYDQKRQKYVGHVNHGHLQIASDDTLASESLTFLVVGIKKFFKIPFGYFLIDKIDAQQQAELTKDAISILSEAGFSVEAVVCDGCFTNQATATSMGCNFKSKPMVTSIPHPSKTGMTIPFLFDACHLIKNIRNALGDMGVLMAGNERVEWCFIAELHNLQSNNSLHLCNKLRGAHLAYAKNKMKVALAVQTLSSSVATAIDFLRDDLQLPQFSGSEATCRFIRCFDKLFDICNSTNAHGRGFKSPINAANIPMMRDVISEGIKYILSLSDVHGKLLTTTKRKTGFLGFIVTLLSIQKVAETMLQKGYRFVLTYRLSQDHLETLFGRIRRRGGWNNNPNVLQFKYSLRSLLMKNGVLESSKGNCVSLPSPDTTLFELEVAEAPTQSSNSMPESLMRGILSKPGPYHHHVLHYISGYVQKKLLEKTRCPHCLDFFSAQTPVETPSSQLTQRRNNGGLHFAHRDVISVVSKTDKFLREILISEKEGPIRCVSAKIIMRVSLSVLQATGTSAFNIDHSIDSHIESEDTHQVQIIKFICSWFSRLVLHHHGKIYTDVALL